MYSRFDKDKSRKNAAQKSLKQAARKIREVCQEHGLEIEGPIVLVKRYGGSPWHRTAIAIDNDDL